MTTLERSQIAVEPRTAHPTGLGKAGNPGASQSLSVVALREYSTLAGTPGHMRRAKQARHLLLMHVAHGIGSGR